MTAIDDTEDTQPRTLARNFTVLLSSQATTFVLTVAATVVIPRFLGAAVVGRLQLATAIWAIGLALIGFGMDLAITKGVARDPQRLGDLVATGIVARVLLTVPVTAMLFLYAWLVGYGDQVLVLMAILGVQTLVQAIADIGRVTLTGVERLGPVSLGNVAGRLVAVAGGIAALLIGFGVFAVAILSAIGFVMTLIIQGAAVRRVWRELGSTRQRSVDAASIAALMKESLPYFWVAFFMIAYQQVDTVVISLVVESDEVLGWYSVYDRLAGTLMFVPTAFMTVVLPMLSRRYQHADGANAGHNGILTQRTFRLMLLISVPAGFGLSALSRPLVELLYGLDFSEASQVVAVGGVVISLTYLNTAFAMFLISMDRQRQFVVFIALSALLTIPLDWFLVPYFQDQIGNGAVGGVVAYAITESVTLAGAIYLLPRGSLNASSALFAVRVVLAGGLMVAAVFPLRNEFLGLPIVVGVVVFAVSALALRLISREDRALVLGALPERLANRF